MAATSFPCIVAFGTWRVLIILVTRERRLRDLKFAQHSYWTLWSSGIPDIPNESNVFVFSGHNQQDPNFHNLFISVRRSACFRRFFRPSSGAQNCTYSVRYWSDKYLTLYVQFWAPDDCRKTRLKHVQRLTEINKLWNVASCWLCSANILAMHGPMNVKIKNNAFVFKGW